MRHELPRSLTALVIGVAIVFGLMIALPTTARAVSGADWRAGSIIEDSLFYDSSSLSEAQIGAVINEKGANCKDSTVPCLKNYVTSTPQTVAEAGLCAAMPAAATSTAAAIIYRVAQACRISPKTILVMIQKESALVTTSSPTPSMYRATTGFACPDTAPCDAQYYGFFNQIYRMARQFQVYTNNPTRYGYQKGRNNTILYNPTLACGSSSVYITSQATANLYIYTPYQPNKAALDNLYGTGDSCSAYGNRNFWRLFIDWFGGTGAPGRSPLGAYDYISTDGESKVHLSGWAFDPDASSTSSSVAVYRNGVGISWFLASQPRADVNGAYGISGDHGFEIDLSSQPPGVNEYCVFAIADRPSEVNPLIGCRTVTIASPQSPIGHTEAVSIYGKTVTLSGWAFDPNSAATSIYLAPFRGSLALEWQSTPFARPDVNAVYGLSGNHGYNLTFSEQPAGNQTYCVYAIDTSGQSINPWLGCHTVSIPSRAPRGFLDGTQGGIGEARLVGWAFDEDVPRTDTPIAIYRDGVGISWYPTSTPRPDVVRAFGLGGGNHGFDVTLKGQPPGSHQYCVFAIADVGYEPNSLFACTTVSVS